MTGKRLIVMAGLLGLISIDSWVSAQLDGGRIPTGQAIYDEHCARCHGLNGNGNGPDAEALIVPPANFHSQRSRAKTDFELLTIIAYGVAFSPMHGWSGRISDEEITAVIAYIRTLAPFAPAL